MQLPRGRSLTSAFCCRRVSSRSLSRLELAPLSSVEREIPIPPLVLYPGLPPTGRRRGAEAVSRKSPVSLKVWHGIEMHEPLTLLRRCGAGYRTHLALSLDMPKHRMGDQSSPGPMHPNILRRLILHRWLSLRTKNECIDSISIHQRGSARVANEAIDAPPKSPSPDPGRSSLNFQRKPES